MTETKTTAIKPGGVVSHVDTKFFEQSSDNRSALTAVDFGIIDRIFSDDLVVVTGGMHRGGDRTHIHKLALRKSIAHGVDPFAVMDDLFGDDKWLTHLVKYTADIVAQFLVMDELLANFLVMPETGAAMDHREVSRFIGGSKV